MVALVTVATLATVALVTVATLATVALVTVALRFGAGRRRAGHGQRRLGRSSRKPAAATTGLVRPSRPPPG